MDIAKAAAMLQEQAKWDGVGLLELLETCQKWGVHNYVQSAGLGKEFVMAYNTFMTAGRSLFERKSS